MAKDFLGIQELRQVFSERYSLDISRGQFEVFLKAYLPNQFPSKNDKMRHVSNNIEEFYDFIVFCEHIPLSKAPIKL